MAHVLALATGRTVYAFGRNDKGQCGLGGEAAVAAAMGETVILLTLSLHRY